MLGKMDRTLWIVAGLWSTVKEEKQGLVFRRSKRGFSTLFSHWIFDRSFFAEFPEMLVFVKSSMFNSEW